MSVDKTINFTERSAAPDTPATSDWRLYFKDDGLYIIDDAGAETLLGAAGGGGADTALSNLAAVAINTSLISDTDSTDDLGSTSVYWRNAYVDTAYLTEQSAPSTPAAGKVVIYPKADGLMYSKDDAGVETLMSGGAGGGGMTDFLLAGDSGTPETVADGNTLSVLGGDGITTTVSATDTVTAAVDNTVIRTTGTQAIAAGLTVTAPTIADFTNMAHDHLDADDGGTLSAAAIASGTLLHERGGLEADVSAYAGVPLISGGSTTELKYNHAGTTAPTANEDSGDGYVVGSRWIDTTNDKEYVCLDNTLTAAVWTETTQGAGGGGSDSFATLVDSKANGTAGGASATTTWNQRPFTEGEDADGLITVSSNQVTPISGTYRIQVWALVYKSTAQKLRFYNVTGAAVVAYGLNARSGNGDDSSTMCYLECTFTANGTDAYRIDHYTQVAQATNGLGVQLNIGFTEDYLFARITKLT